MKKAALLVFAALLVVMFTVPAMAMEHQFGGYWRTRFYTNQNFDGNDFDGPGVNTGDWAGVDTRTRLYYTAVFHENLKFVNKFEFDGSWGSGGQRLDRSNGQALAWGSRGQQPGDGYYTDIAADGANIEIKNSYVDFNVGPLFAKVGVQPMYLARFFVGGDDAAGLIAGYKGDGITIPFVWVKAYEGGIGDNALDCDYFALDPSFSFNNIKINPFLIYAYSENGSEHWAPVNADVDVDVYFAGLNADFNFDPFSFWLTGFYEGGSLDVESAGQDVDISAWLGALGLSFNFGMGDVHAEFLYATGEDLQDNDNDIEAVTYLDPAWSSYYWAEIMGFGVFDHAAPANTPGDDISNLIAANIGVKIKPMDKLSIGLDAWWAQKNEEIWVGGEWEDDLGAEVDLKITYQLVEGLNLDVVGAYLFAGDAIYNGNDDADPYEIGSRLSLSF